MARRQAKGSASQEWLLIILTAVLLAMAASAAHAQSRSRTRARPVSVTARRALVPRRPSAERPRRERRGLARIERARRVARSKSLSTGRTQRVRSKRGSTLFVSARSNLQARIKKTMGWQKSDKIFSLVFIGGAGAHADPATEKAAVALARAYARAYRRGAFGDYKVVVASGAAPGLPDAMMKAFAEIAPEVPRVGYSPYKSPALHQAISPWQGYDFVRLIEPIPHVLEADHAQPGYTIRQEAMLHDASMVVAAGGRFGTGEEGFMTLERGKALVLLNESTGIGVTSGFASMVERSIKAGKPPLAPVVVTPAMNEVKSTAMPRVVRRIANLSVRKTLANLERGPRRHTEATEKLATDEGPSMLQRMTFLAGEQAAP